MMLAGENAVADQLNVVIPVVPVTLDARPIPEGVLLQIVRGEAGVATTSGTGLMVIANWVVGPSSGQLSFVP